MIVKFHETPSYRCPLAPDEDPENYSIPSDPSAILPHQVVLEKSYGPATYKGLRWVGEFDKIEMELWERDAAGKAVRKGSTIDMLQADNVQIAMGDILPAGYPQTLTLRLDEFRASLRDPLQALALNRCQDTTRRYKERQGKQDREYQP